MYRFVTNNTDHSILRKILPPLLNLTTIIIASMNTKKEANMQQCIDAVESLKTIKLRSKGQMLITQSKKCMNT